MRISHRLICIVALGAAHVFLTNSAVAGEDASEEQDKRPKQKEKKPDKKVQKPDKAEQRARNPDAPPELPTLPPIPPDQKSDFPTKTERDFIDSPSTYSVLRKEEIQGSGVRYPSDVLRLIPGLEVQRVYSTLSSVGVRGFNDSPTTAQGILALIDGRQVYNDFLGNPLWDQLMLIPEDIEQIDVIRGPGSFLYGPNAMHGLVNFITKSPLDYTGSEVSVLGAVGSYDSILGRVRYVQRDKESGSGLVATLVYDDIDQFEPSDADARDKVYGTVRFEKDLGGGSRGDSEKSGHRLEVGAGISDQKLDLLLATLDLFPGLPPVPSDIYAADVQETYVTGKYTLGDLVAQATWTGFDSSLAAGMFYAPFDLDLDTLDFDVHYSFDLLKDHELTVGAGYRYSTFNTENLDVSNGRQSTNLFSAFVQDEVTLVSDKLFLTAGVRVDHHSEAGANVAPRAALVWRLQESHSLRASYGTGHRNPSLLENWLNLPLMLPLGTATIMGNKDLDAEKMESFELGYRGWFKEDKLRVGVTGYLNYIDNLVEFQMVAPATVAPVNQDEYRAYGIELEGEYAFSESFSAFGNYSYGILEDRATGDRIREGPRNKANLGLRYATYLKSPTGSRVDAMVWMTYFDDTVFPGGAVDEYVLLNGSASLEFAKGRSAFIKVFNLLDNDHREHPGGNKYGMLLQVGLQFKW